MSQRLMIGLTNDQCHTSKHINQEHYHKVKVGDTGRLKIK